VVKRQSIMKEYIAAVAVQSLKSKVPTDFRFEETKIMINLDRVSWFKQYWNVATEKFKHTYTEVLIHGQEIPILIVIPYEEFKQDISNFLKHI